MLGATENPRDFDPRHRIIGAIIIVLLVVVFVPMFLGDPEELSRHANERLDDNGQQVDDGVKRYVTDLSGKTNNMAGSSGADSAGGTSMQQRVQTQDQGSSAAKRAAQPNGGNGNNGSAASWEVRIGTFSKPENARNLVKQLKKLQFDAQSSKVGSSYIRVWMGSYGSQEEAEKMAQKLDKLARVKALVVKQ